MRTALSIPLLLLLLVGCHSTGTPSIRFLNRGEWTEHPGGHYQLAGATASGNLTVEHHWPDRRRECAHCMLRMEHLPAPFEGEKCHGRFYMDEMKDGARDQVFVIYMMQVNGTLWSGRFRGSREGWERALALLRSSEVAH